MSVLNRPSIRAFIGASGSGKGVSVNALLAEEKPARLLVWDPRDEYAKHARAYTSITALVAAVKKAGTGPFRARFVPTEGADLAALFGLVCALAFAAGDLMFLAEELSDVTTASHAPAPWRRCCTQGRHRGLRLVGVAQRPALIDKNFLGSCTFIRCFTLRYEADRRAMAAALDCPLAEITALQTTEEGARTVIRYVEREFRGGQSWAAGEITLKRRA